MYGALIVFSVPMPLVAGWLSDRIGRKPLIVGVYLGGALGFVVFLLAGSSIVWLWAGILLMGLFSFAESPQLQALLGDISPPSTRDASYALYFTLAFGVGSLWVALYGVIIEAAGDAVGAADRVPADGRLVRARGAGHAADPCRAAGARERRLRGGAVAERAPAGQRSGGRRRLDWHTAADAGRRRRAARGCGWTPGSCSSRTTPRSAK